MLTWDQILKNIDNRAKKTKKKEKVNTFFRVSIKDGIQEDRINETLGFVYDESKYDNDGKRKQEKK